MYKLIRDNIPDIAKKSGEQLDYATIMNDELYKNLLIKKLYEEVDELKKEACFFDHSLDPESGIDPEICEETLKSEIADVQEVLDAIAFAYKLDFGEIRDYKKNKAEVNGKFEKRLVGFFEDK